MNTVILTGRLGQDPKGRESKAGGQMASFSIATTRPTKGRETDWHNCTVLRADSAAALLEHAHKGDALTVQGSLQYWDGETKHNAEIIVSQWEFTPSGGRNDRQENPRPAKPRAPNGPDDGTGAGDNGFPF